MMYSWCSFQGWEEFRKRHKMHRFRESVNNGKNDSVTLSPKSKAMCDHGQPGTGKGQSRPAVGCWEAFLWAHTVQEDTKVRVSVSMVDHQRCQKGSEGRGCDLSGWQANWDSWVHWWTWVPTESGTKRYLSGPVPGSGLVCWAALTIDSTSFFFFFFNLIAATTQDKGRMVSRLEGLSCGTYWRERALGWNRGGR